MYEIDSVRLQELRSLETCMQISEEAALQLGDVSLVGLTGPSGVGKSTIIRASGLYAVPGFTSRPVRNDVDDMIRHLPHTQSSIDECIDKAHSGELVQVKIGPQGYIYGSEFQDYKPGETNVIDMNARSIAALSKLPFCSVAGIVLVAPFGNWIDRFEVNRGSVEQHKDRLWSDLDSLVFTEGYHDAESDFFFSLLTNRQGRINATTKMFLDMIKGEVSDDDGRAALDDRDSLITGISTLI